MILLMFLVAAGTALVDWITKLLSVKYLSGTVVVIEKLRPTPKDYPRQYNRIKKNPR